MTSSPHRPVSPAPCATADADASAALAALRAVVRRTDYDTVIRVHDWERAPRWLDASLRRTADRAPAATQTALRLWSFGETVRPAALDGIVGAGELQALRDAGLLTERSDGVAARYRLDVADDQLLLVEWPAARATGVYYGEDSQFLRAMLTPRTGDACLDLCTGSGVQALRCARVAQRVDAVDLNPEAVRLARLNAALNEVAGRLAVHQGDLWNALPADARWDYVVSNPPLVPVPEAVPYPLCGDGGADGLDVVRRILDGLGTHLAPGGRCSVIGACTGDADGPAVRAELERVAAATGMSFSLFLFLRASLRDWVRMLADTVGAIYHRVGRSGGPAGAAGNTVLRCRARYGDAFDETWVYTFLVQGVRDGTAPGCRTFDYTGFDHRSYWFVNRGRVVP